MVDQYYDRYLQWSTTIAFLPVITWPWYGSLETSAFQCISYAEGKMLNSLYSLPRQYSGDKGSAGYVSSHGGQMTSNINLGVQSLSEPRVLRHPSLGDSAPRQYGALRQGLAQQFSAYDPNRSKPASVAVACSAAGAGAVGAAGYMWYSTRAVGHADGEESQSEKSSSALGSDTEDILLDEEEEEEDEDALLDELSRHLTVTSVDH